LALSTALCSYLQVVILVVFLRRALLKQAPLDNAGKKYLTGQAVSVSILDGLALTLLKTIAATLGMTAVIITAQWLSQSWHHIFKLLLIVPSAASAYLLAAKFLHIEMLSLLTGRKHTTNGSIDD